MLPKSPAAEPQWPPRSPRDVLLSTPSGRARLQRMAAQTSPSPLRTRAYSVGNDGLNEDGDGDGDGDGDEDEDEETLQLKLQEIQAKLRLKKLQSAKAQKSATEAAAIRPSAFSASTSSTPALRVNPLPQRPRSSPTKAVEVPASPVRRAQPAAEAMLASQKSPRRVLLGIDKGLRGQDVSLKRPPSGMRRGLSLTEGSRAASSLGVVAETSREARQSELRPLSFNERLAAARVQETALQDRKEKIQKLRSGAFAVGKEEVEVYKTRAMDIPLAPEKPQQFTREDIIDVAVRGKKPPGDSQLLHRSRTMPSLRADGDGDGEERARSGTPAPAPANRAADGTGDGTTADSPSSFEPYSGFHLSRRILPHTVVARAVAGKTIYMLQDLLREVKAPNFELPDVETDVVVLAIVASKSDPRAHKPVSSGGADGGSSASASASAAAKKKEEDRGKYMVVTLVDLTYQVDLFLFKSGFERYWKLSTGTVVAILNPVVMPPPPGRHDTGRWGLVINSDADTILEIGTARDLGYCKSVKKDGHLCSDWVNAKRTEFCEFHTNEAVRRMRATRNEINGAAGFGGGRQQQQGGRPGSSFSSRGTRSRGGSGSGWGGREPTSNTGYDWTAHSRYFMSGSASASSLLDGDGGGYADKVERQEGIKRRLAAKERETDIARKLGELGAGAGRDYMQLTALDRAVAAVGKNRAATPREGSGSRAAMATATTGMSAAEQAAASRASLLASVASRRGAAAGAENTGRSTSSAATLASHVIQLGPLTKRKRSQSVLSSRSQSSVTGGETEPTARDRMAGLGWGSGLRNKLGRMKEGERLTPATMTKTTMSAASASVAAAAAAVAKKGPSPERSPVRKKTRFLLGGKGIREAGRESLGIPQHKGDSGARIHQNNADVDPMNNRTSSASAPSFAEAQRRLAERRRDRERGGGGQSAPLRGVGSRPASERHGRGVGQSALLQRVGGKAMAAWERLGGSSLSSLSSLSPPSFRVGQVDAELLDEELLSLMQTQVGEALRHVRGGTLGDDWGAEILLGLRAALFKLSVWDHDATYGAALQNLRFADARQSVAPGVVVAPSRWQKALYGVATVGGRYAWTKWEDWLRDNDGGDEDEDEDEAYSEVYNDRTRGTRISAQMVRRLARVTGWMTDAYAAAALVSFLVFLRHGRYRTLLDRVLRMRLVPPTSQVSREVSFEYLNRQLVWHAFTEFLLFVLPLVGIQRWRRWAARTWRRARSWGSKGTTAKEEMGTGGVLSFLPERTCAICYQDQNTATSEADVLAQAAASSGVVGSAETDVTNPYEAAPCGCVYCYVCVATRIEREEGDGWTCLRCGAVARSCRPWSGDVLEAAGSGDGDETAARALGAVATVTADRPSTSSSTASHHPHKTVGFADDVKAVDEDEDEGEDGSQDEVIVDEAEDGNGLADADTSAGAVSMSDSGSEAYEEDEASGEMDA
ncbi:peroxisomal biogenesis factor 2 [Grosmannia clavigera kw1407]|uniref:Peroxisomal biogenesis factor 2 n=1 Tax=Grosmannia clavigera (strain kw1407 / UAMH 11150) TaxID=655863 RepID=F0XMN3_GROCL|nr:peroxisomal biogenesis factor 2 [Grosmannia clavigera kw1407]EFX01040.1 peroxisomal biogenesis factor 2 [Grosmannia clavigera kw1407]